jgi:hypothetical protein
MSYNSDFTFTIDSTDMTEISDHIENPIFLSRMLELPKQVSKSIDSTFKLPMLPKLHNLDLATIKSHMFYKYDPNLTSISAFQRKHDAGIQLANNTFKSLQGKSLGEDEFPLQIAYVVHAKQSPKLSQKRSHQ